MQNRGGSLLVARYLGKDHRMLQRYTHLRAEDLAKKLG
jgi:hypothetical protein